MLFLCFLTICFTCQNLYTECSQYWLLYNYIYLLATDPCKCRWKGPFQAGWLPQTLAWCPACVTTCDKLGFLKCNSSDSTYLTESLKNTPLRWNADYFVRKIFFVGVPHFHSITTSMHSEYCKQWMWELIRWFLLWVLSLLCSCTLHCTVQWAGHQRHLLRWVPSLSCLTSPASLSYPWLFTETVNWTRACKVLGLLVQ